MPAGLWSWSQPNPPNPTQPNPSHANPKTQPSKLKPQTSNLKPQLKPQPNPQPSLANDTDLRGVLAKAIATAAATAGDKSESSATAAATAAAAAVPTSSLNPNEASMDAADAAVVGPTDSVALQASTTSSSGSSGSKSSPLATMAFTCGHTIPGPRLGDAVAEFLRRVEPLGAPIAAAVAADEYVRAARGEGGGLVTLPCPRCCAEAMLAME